jgi:hypothetical protein
MAHALQDFDFGLGETIDMLRDSTAAFAQREIARCPESTAATSFRGHCGRSSDSSALG